MISKKAQCLLSFLFFAMIPFAKGQYRLKFTPQYPVAGQNTIIHYDAAGTPLQDQKNISVAVYSFINYDWKAVDIKMIPEGKDKWFAKFAPAVNCAFLAFKFTSGDSVDNNNNKAYGALLRTPADTSKMMPGSYAGWGLARSPRYGYFIPHYIDEWKGISDTLTNFWLEKELQAHDPKAKSILAVPYATSIYRAFGKDRIGKIQPIINYLTRPGASERELLDARYLLVNVLNQATRGDSLENVIKQRYPNGYILKLNAYQKFLQQKATPDISVYAEAFLDQYPYSKADHFLDKQNKIDYDRAYLTAVLLKIGKDDFRSIDKYLSELTYNATINVYYKTIEVSHSRKTISDGYLYPYSEKLVKHMEQFQVNRPYEFLALSPADWLAEFNSKYASGVYKPMLFTHISICSSVQKYEEALRYARIAQSMQHYRKAELNDDYVFLLNQAGFKKDAKEAAVKSMYLNQASSPIVELLKQDYMSKNHTETGFNAYLETLKGPELSKSDTPLKQLNQPMVDWAMYDLNDKKINLASLKGKTIVMDFWATWCVPCKASFPGMKLAVEKYKNDPTVVFYFVDTEERTADYKQQVKKYIQDNHYPFQVLFDNPIANSKNTGEVFERICSAFKISGIPQKIIIDKNGLVNYITVGFNGSASKLADEISNMVELTKKKN